MTHLTVVPTVSAEAHPAHGCSERIEALLREAREQERWIPVEQVVGIVVGVLSELQKADACRVHVSAHTVWIRVDGRITLAGEPAALGDVSAGDGPDDPSQLEAVAALLERLASVADLHGEAVLNPQCAVAFEKIRARATSADPNLRYADTGALLAALEHLAVQTRLETSDLARARFLFSILPQQTACRTTSPDSFPYSARTLTLVRDAAADDDAPETIRTPTRAAVSAILLQGRVEDRLAAATLAAAPGFRIVLDFAAQDRLPDANVPAWLALLAAVDAHDDAELWLARVPPGFVRQAMQRPSLLDKVRVASVAVPVLCRSCGSSSRRVLDVERDRGELRWGHAACPRCAAHASLAEDTDDLAFLGARAGGVTPDEVRAAMEELETELASSTPAPVERQIEAPRGLLPEVEPLPNLTREQGRDEEGSRPSVPPPTAPPTLGSSGFCSSAPRFRSALLLACSFALVFALGFLASQGLHARPHGADHEATRCTATAYAPASVRTSSET